MGFIYFVLAKLNCEVSCCKEAALMKHSAGGTTMIEKRYDTSEIYAASGALIAGVTVHGFALFNILHNYDNILQQPRGYGAGITSGRWLLSLMGDFLDKYLDLSYNLPLVNGLLFLVLIALSAAVVVNILQIKNRVSSVLIGCMMVTFPAVCATMAFRFTVVYYGFSLLLSVLCVWTAERGKLGVLLSVVCLACSMGIYQAYAPVSIGLLVLILMKDAMKEDADFQKLVGRGLRYCAILILGVLLYFVLLKLSMKLYAQNGPVILNSYQGIDQMGQISLTQLPKLLRRAWTSAALFSVRDYCDLAPTKIIKILWSVLVLCILLVTVYILIYKKVKPLPAAFCCVMGMLFPLAVNFIVIMCPDGNVYTIMVYAFVLIGCVPLMLLERLPENTGRANRRISRFVSVITAAIIFYNGYYTNFNYTALYYANEQVKNYLTALTAQIRMAEGYTPEKKWAFLGEIQDPDMIDMWKDQWMGYEDPPYYGGIKSCTAEELLTTSYSFDFWVHSYIGYIPEKATQEEMQSLAAEEQVAEMPCWPSEGSIKVVNEYLVVKFQELFPDE